MVMIDMRLMPDYTKKKACQPLWQPETSAQSMVVQNIPPSAPLPISFFFSSKLEVKGVILTRLEHSCPTTRSYPHDDDDDDDNDDDNDNDSGDDGFLNFVI